MIEEKIRVTYFPSSPLSPNSRVLGLVFVEAMIHAFGVNKRIKYKENLALLLGQNKKDENNKTPKVLGNQNNKEDMYI